MSDDDDIIAQARAGFLDEAAQLLKQFEDALLVMETQPDDTENLNAAFRAAHTIKGTAGLFGYDAVVSFTHHAETLMESLRSGALKVNDDVIAVLLQSRDQMERLLDEVQSGDASPEVAALSLSIGRDLKALTGKPMDEATASANAPDTTAQTPAPSLAPAASPCALWHLSLRFGPDALRNGLDPLAFFRYLARLGDIRHLRLLDDTLPTLEALDAEACHLGFEIALDSAATQTEVEDVFEFARDDCAIAVLPPTASAADYAALLDERCGTDVQARDALLSLWAEQGVELTRRATAPKPQTLPDTGPAGAESDDAEVPAAAPVEIERRATPVESSDRRGNPPERRDGAKDRRSDETRFIRVRADKLDQLIDLIGELVIASSGAQIVAQQEKSPAFIETAHRIRDLVEAARDGTLGLRMVPIGETFARFHRVVRDVGKQLGKDVQLEISGADTEMDKSMVDAIADPLMHLVRNSLDHGVETAADRQAAGKPGTARVALHAYHEGGQIVIEVSDDGRGLNRERIFNKAVEKGLISADAQLSDNEVHQLISLPGFSTAEQVTDISGRGVGMDVVKRNIDALRGQMHIASAEGHGTTMQIRLPLTLAIIDGFLCAVDSVHYVVPLALVAECIETPMACRQGSGVAGYFDLRGEVLPYLNLRRYLGHPDATQGRQSMIVVRLPNQRVGLLVDRLLGEYQTVIKPLGRLLRNVRVIAGSTILGTGEVALVLDVGALIANATALLGAHGGQAAPASGVTAPC